MKSDEIPWLGAHPCIAVLPPDLGPGFLLPSGAPVHWPKPNGSAILVAICIPHQLDPPTTDENLKYSPMNSGRLPIFMGAWRV